MFVTLCGFRDKNCCPKALGKLGYVDAFVYLAVKWCVWSVLVMLKILRNTNITKSTDSVKTIIHRCKILPV
jgi:hypothetical protein